MTSTLNPPIDSLFEAERAAHQELLAARDEVAQARNLESAIFDTYLLASKIAAAATKREDAVFYAWYVASKALDNERNG